MSEAGAMTTSGSLSQNPGEPGLRVSAVEFGGLNESIGDGRIVSREVV